MQVWQQVKVIDVNSAEAGRAGLVVKVEAIKGGDSEITVALDETDAYEKEDMIFTAAQLQVLG